MTHADASVFVTVAVAHALAVMSPGPDFAIVIRQSLGHGRAAGVWAAAGIGSGIVLHVGYGLFGLGWAIDAFPPLLHLIALAGAGFLIWIGIKSLHAQPMADEAVSGRNAPSAARGYLLGLATNVLNPKAILFFVALFSVAVAGSSSWTVRIAIGVWLPLATFGWFATLALLLSHAGLRRRLRRSAHWIDRAMGVVLLLFAAGMLISEALLIFDL